MSLLSSVGVALLCAVCALVLKECKSPLSPFLTLGGGILLLLALIPRLSPVLALAEELKSSLPAVVGESAAKVLAVGLLSGLGADVCNDLGAPSLGTRLSFVGRMEILLLSLPVLRELLCRIEVLLS